MPKPTLEPVLPAQVTEWSRQREKYLRGRVAFLRRRLRELAWLADAEPTVARRRAVDDAGTELAEAVTTLVFGEEVTE